MLTRTIADLTFEAHSPHQYRLIVPDDPSRPGHSVWMVYNGEHWYLIYCDGQGGQRERAFKEPHADSRSADARRRVAV